MIYFLHITIVVVRIIESSVMFGRAVSMDALGNDVSILRDTLCAQGELLKKLQQELDAERESSATAASEALSMILRLQGEKAALAMEASQYKRMAEQRMCHAETSLGLYEDVLTQKELEITSLEYQVQAYEYKLLSCGYYDLDFNYQSNNETTKHAGGSRSLPLMIQNVGSADEREMKISIGNRRSRDVSPFSDMDPVSTDKVVIKQSFDSRKQRKNPTPHREDSDSDREEIKTSSERIEEVSECKNMANIKSSLVSDKANAADDSVGSSKIHDIFVIPQKKENGKDTIDAEEFMKPYSKDELHILKKVTEKARGGRKLSKMAKERKAKKERDGAGERDATLKQLRERIEQLERQTGNAKTEIEEVERPDDGYLLKEIKQQLNSVQAELRIQKLKKRSVPPLPRPSPPPEGHLLLSIKRALFPFWI